MGRERERTVSVVINGMQGNGPLGCRERENGVCGDQWNAWQWEDREQCLWWPLGCMAMGRERTVSVVTIGIHRKWMKETERAIS